MIHTSPQLLRDPQKLRLLYRAHLILVLIMLNTIIGELVDAIDDMVLDNYFRHWHGEMSKYKYSGPLIIDEKQFEAVFFRH